MATRSQRLEEDALDFFAGMKPNLDNDNLAEGGVIKEPVRRQGSLAAILKDIPIDSIEVMPQVRTGKMPDLEGLLTTLTSVGLIHAIVVEKSSSPLFRYRLVAGERRFTAAKELGWQSIQALERPIMNEVLRLEIQLIENIQKVGLTGEDRKRAFLRLRELHGGSTKIAAERLGIHPASFRRVVMEQYSNESAGVKRISTGQFSKAASRITEMVPTLPREKKEELLKEAEGLVNVLRLSLRQED